jgi:hypothetical protein
VRAPVDAASVKPPNRSTRLNAGAFLSGSLWCQEHLALTPHSYGLRDGYFVSGASCTSIAATTENRGYRGKTMAKRFANALVVLAIASSLTLASAPQVHAGNGVGLGIAAGIIGLGVGAAIAHDPYYYGPRYYSRYDDGRCFYGDRVCHWSHRHCFEMEYGDAVCRGGRYLCDRPLICN